MKRLLKWLGGKKFLAPKIKPLLRSDSRWFDMFCGACSLPLELGLENVVANDINHNLIDFYNWLKYDGEEFSVEFENSSPSYYKVREEFNRTGCPELFYYLNQTCVNGIVRYNLSGDFNTPYGGNSRKINYSIDPTYRDKISNWRFTNNTYEKSFSELIPGDILFLDPPYDSHDTAAFTSYFGKFDWEDQRHLAKMAASHNGMVIACNKATPRIIRLYEGLGFHVETIEVARKVAANGDRTPVLEMFAVKR